MQTYRGHLNGRVEVDRDLITLKPSGIGTRTHQFFVRSVKSVRVREATRLVNGELSVTYVGAAGGASTVSTIPGVVFRKGKASQETLAAAAWLRDLASYNEAHGYVPAPPSLEGGEKGTMSPAEAHEAADALARESWLAQYRYTADLLALAESGGLEEPGAGFLLKSGEKVFALIPGAHLIEPRRPPGHWEGRSQGMSFRVAKGVSYRVGANRGTYVQGPEQPASIDQGKVLISNMRVAFAGSKQSREWLFSKLIGYSHDPSGDWTALQVSNRQKTSGIAYGAGAAGVVHPRLDMALAASRGELGAVVDQLRAQVLELEQIAPAAA